MSAGWLVLSSLAAGAAVAALVRDPVRLAQRRPGRASPVLWAALALCFVLVLVFPSVSGRAAALVLICAGCTAGGLVLLRLRRLRGEIVSGQARVLDFCQLVAAELAAGQPPGTALERGAAEWPQLAPVASAFELGGDVPSALRRAALARGQGDLGLAAAAWQVAHQTGGGLSTAVARVAAGLRATQATRRVVNAELASARATARLMAGLPVLALLMGNGIGGDPLSFLFASTGGLFCLSGGLTLGFVGLWWIEAIADGVASGGP